VHVQRRDTHSAHIMACPLRHSRRNSAHRTTARTLTTAILSRLTCWPLGCWRRATVNGDCPAAVLNRRPATHRDQTSPSAPGVVDVRNMASNDAKAHWTTSRPWCESAAVPLVERGRRNARWPAPVTPGRHPSQRRRSSSPHPIYCRNDRNKAQLLTALGIATQRPIAATTQRTNLRNTRAWASRVSLRCSLARRVSGLFPDLNHAQTISNMTVLRRRC
jgi:hypothetical protein